MSVKDGLVKLLKKESMTRGIQVTLRNNKLTLDFHVIVSYGVSILAVSDNLIDSVKYKVGELAPVSRSAATSFAADIIVNVIFVPVSPSGTGNTFNSLIHSRWIRIWEIFQSIMKSLRNMPVPWLWNVSVSSAWQE